MDNDIDQILNEFNQKAQEEFFFLFDKFKTSVKKINRIKDDNVFQMQHGKYIYSLKERLEILAKETLHRNRLFSNINLLNKVLTGAISYYLNEFRKKSQTL